MMEKKLPEKKEVEMNRDTFATVAPEGALT